MNIIGIPSPLKEKVPAEQGDEVLMGIIGKFQLQRALSHHKKTYY